MTVHATVNGEDGFTLIELLLVLMLVALLAGIAAPVVSSSIQRGKESTLKEDLFVMRKAIDDYYADTGRYPEQLEVLEDKRYLRRIPNDPFTGRIDTWELVRSSTGEPYEGISDVRSGQEGSASDGSMYKSW